MKKKNLTICLSEKTIGKAKELATTKGRSVSGLIEGLINGDYSCTSSNDASFNNGFIYVGSERGFYISITNGNNTYLYKNGSIVLPLSNDERFKNIMEEYLKSLDAIDYKIGDKVASKEAIYCTIGTCTGFTDDDKCIMIDGKCWGGKTYFTKVEYEFCKEVLEVMSKMTSEYDLEMWIEIDKRIRESIENGTWDKLESLYIYSDNLPPLGIKFAPGNEHDALINWIKP